MAHSTPAPAAPAVDVVTRAVSPLSVALASLAALVAAGAAAYVAGAWAVAGFGAGNTALVAGAVVGIAAAILPLGVARALVTPVDARLRVFAELNALALLVVAVAAPQGTVRALAAHGTWPARVVGVNAVALARVVDVALVPVRNESDDDAGVADAVRGGDGALDPVRARVAARHRRAAAVGATTATAKMSAKDVFAKDAASVVVINVKKALAKDDPFAVAARMYGIDELEAQGSGFFVGKNLVVTNDHVVSGATSVAVHVKDGAVVTNARILAVDPKNDLALLEVEAPMHALALADGADVGDDAIAIGCPLGLDYTLTTGLVSAHRDMDGTRFLQVQTTIAPGSSGGPLLDDRGRVIGVTTATRGAGLNLAVDVAHVKALLTAERTPTALAAWTEDPLVLVSFETTGQQPLPTTRETMLNAVQILGRAVDGCATSGDVDVRFELGKASGASADVNRCIDRRAGLPLFALMSHAEPGIPMPDTVDVHYRHGERDLALHVVMHAKHGG